MKILAIDSSSRRRSVALCKGVRGSWNTIEVLGSADAPSERGGRFASLVEDVLNDSGVGRAEVDAIAVGVGPGSAAGIRSTLSFALGWKLARDVSLTGFSSAWGLAVEAQRLGNRGEIGVVLPGPLGKVIYGRFRIEAEAIEESQRIQLIDELSMEQLRAESGKWIGPDLSSILATPADSESLGPADDGTMTVFPTATALAELLMRDAAEAVRPLEPETLVSSKFVQAPPPREIPGI